MNFNVDSYPIKPVLSHFPLGDYFRANKEKANVIGFMDWVGCRQCLTPTNQVAFFSVRVENRLNYIGTLFEIKTLLVSDMRGDCLAVFWFLRF